MKGLGILVVVAPTSALWHWLCDQERATIRSQVRPPGPIDMADALESSVTLNVPAIWWVRLVAVGLPVWLATLIGLSACATLAVLLRLLLSPLPVLRPDESES